ncbi:hypothetical protein [Chroococcidiopsis sp [FACHB-1243]]|nr:hypothetical protein [Chroococcidiopsis sp. [FACHB-1243]]
MFPELGAEMGCGVWGVGDKEDKGDKGDKEAILSTGSTSHWFH